MSPGTAHARKVIRLLISLIDSDPPIWRRLLVPATVRLDKLHRMFQVVMGWTDSHLHMFRIEDDVLYTSYDHDLLQGELDERTVTFEQALGDRVSDKDISTRGPSTSYAARVRIRAFVLVVGVLLVAAIPTAAHATPAGHRLTGTVSGTAVEVTDPTCPPNFLGVTPQRRLLITATVSGAMPHETITVGVCQDCCHPGGWDTNGGWAEIRTPAGILSGIVRGGSGGWWGFSIGITMTSGTRGLAQDVGRNFSLIEPFNVNNDYTATGVIDPGTFLREDFF